MVYQQDIFCFFPFLSPASLPLLTFSFLGTTQLGSQGRLPHQVEEDKAMKPEPRPLSEAPEVAQSQAVSSELTKGLHMYWPLAFTKRNTGPIRTADFLLISKGDSSALGLPRSIQRSFLEVLRAVQFPLTALADGISFSQR